MEGPGLPKRSVLAVHWRRVPVGGRFAEIACGHALESERHWTHATTETDRVTCIECRAEIKRTRQGSLFTNDK